MASNPDDKSYGLTTRGEKRMFGGVNKLMTHKSTVLADKPLDMNFSIFLPPQAESSNVPSILWLSGLTCTDENFRDKAGAQRVAAQLGVALLMPSTSPPKMGYPGETDKYDFGFKASMYVDATEAPWKNGYQMYSYIMNEFLPMCMKSFNLTPKISIFGHSMGGHGALMFHLKNPGAFTSCSAFSPICNPTKCPWGVKAFTNYLGSVEAGEAYDATCLLKGYQRSMSCDEHKAPMTTILIDQGKSDNFLTGDVNQLQPLVFKRASLKFHVPVKLRMRTGYDHSYFFIATFVEEHIRFHAMHLLD